MDSSPKWHFFLHGTYIENIISILKSGGIEGRGTVFNKSSDYLNRRERGESTFQNNRGVYTQYLFSEMPKIKDLTPMFEWHYKMRSSIIVLDPIIAKDLEMFVCNGVAGGTCMNHPEDQLMYSKGNLKRMPSLKKLKTYILETINSCKNNKRELIHSYNMRHEVIFPEIPIHYIRAILIPSLSYERKSKEILEEFIKTNNLPIKVIKYAVSQYSKKSDFHQYFEQI